MCVLLCCALLFTCILLRVDLAYLGSLDLAPPDFNCSILGKSFRCPEYKKTSKCFPKIFRRTFDYFLLFVQLWASGIVLKPPVPVPPLLAFPNLSITVPLGDTCCFSYAATPYFRVSLHGSRIVDVHCVSRILELEIFGGF